MPLRGAKTRWVFIPLRYLREVDPDSCRRSAVGSQSTPLWRLCFPCGRAMPP
ncbi:MAG: hypothetical protein LBK61_00635 [Spirochaetaceae bacterium]|nr:hypothetical protein [Spirochaetaceae bacterium]